MKKKILLSMILILLVVAGCSEQIAHFENSFVTMSTVVSYQVNAEENINVDEIIKEEIIKIEKLMSRTDPESEVFNINKLAGTGEKIKVSEELNDLVEESIHYQNLTDNKFRITIYPLVQAWDIMNPDAPIPTEEEVLRAIELSDVENLMYDKETGSISMLEKGSGLDLGGIAKGYAVDRAVEKLRDKGVNSGFISIGGGIQAFGAKESGDPWVLGLMNPIIPEKGHFATFEINEGAVVTSGDYQRNKERNGIIYHHIINPETGYPVQKGIAAVTIFSENSTEADAYSTAVYIMGFEKGLEFIQQRDNVEAMFVFHDKSVYLTEDIRDRVNIVDSEFYLDETR